MTTKEIKTWLKATFGLKCLSVTSSATKNPYLSARIRPTPESDPRVALTWSEEFPLEFRQICLQSVYGTECAFSHEGSAGNVRHHDIAMHEQQWDSAIATWDTLEAAKRVNLTTYDEPDNTSK